MPSLGRLGSGFVALLCAVMGGLIFASVATAVPNDDFSAAQDLGTSLPISATGNTLGAGAESGEPAHGGAPAAHSVWYRWQAPTSTPVKANVCEGEAGGGSHDVAIRLAVYTGASLSQLTLVGGNGDGSDACSVTFNATAGVTYDLVVDTGDGHPDVYFTLLLHLIEPAPNDDLADAEVISSGSTAIPGTTLGATAESGEPAHAGMPAERSIWYLWSPAEDSLAYTAVCGSEVDIRLAIYDEDGLIPVANNGSYGDCQLSWQAQAGKTYAIALDSGNVQGDTSLRFFAGDPEGGPDNDNFSQAEQFGPGSGGFTLQGATAEDGEPAHSGRPATKSIWFKYTAAVDGVATIGTCGDVAVRMAIYTGTQLQSLTPVADNGADRDCVLQFLVEQGVTYDIAFDSFGDEEDGGGFSFDVYPHPPNDLFADAQPLSLEPNRGESVDGTTRGATAEASEPDHSPGVEAGYSVWYRWTAPRTEQVTFDTCAPFYYTDTLLAVYEGSSLSTVSRLGDNDDGPTCEEEDPGPGNPFGSEVTVDVLAGHEYRVAVDSFEMGDFRLRISYAGPATRVPPPPAATPTGKRAAALKKCKKRHKARARKKCRKKAKRLPV